VIGPAPINAVCLERVASVRHKQDEPSAWTQYPYHLFSCQTVIPNVLEYFMGQNQVKAGVRKRQILYCGVKDQARILMSFDAAFVIVLKPEDMPRKRSKVLYIFPYSTAIF
jgi:hypothetical protein